MQGIDRSKLLFNIYLYMSLIALLKSSNINLRSFFRNNALFTVNNKKNTCAITRTRDFWTAENRKCFVNHIVYRINSHRSKKHTISFGLSQLVLIALTGWEILVKHLHSFVIYYVIPFW